MENCSHTWVAGMCYVDPQDLPSVTANRTVECERCELRIGPNTPADVIDALVWGE